MPGTAMMASVARLLRRGGFGIDRDNVGNDAADAEAGNQTEPGHFGQIGPNRRR